MRNKPWITTIISVPILIGLPLLGVVLEGLPVGRYFEFPPQTRFIKHSPFSWGVFLLYVVIIGGALFPFVYRGARLARGNGGGSPAVGRFPWWGWAGVFSGIAFWTLAWTRFSWFSAFQAHTFTPLWISFIIVTNALCFSRTGRSLITHRPGFLVCLFPLSAVFWWFFEYLNRFVQNWHYMGVRYSASSYVLYASISFSTVLPAVMSVRELVREFRWIQRGFRTWTKFPLVSNRLLGLGCLVAGAGALLLVGIFPNVLFSMLWVAPLVIIVSVQILTGQSHVFSGLSEGDWREIVSSALAALICGWFWEMWNYWSLAKWEYTIPFVDRFHVFEMPILGYGGYLPFGLECAAVAGLINSVWNSPIPQSCGTAESSN